MMIGKRYNHDMRASLSIYDMNDESKEEAEVLPGIGDREPSFPFLTSFSNIDSFSGIGNLEPKEEAEVFQGAGPSFPSFTSFTEFETQPDELDFLDSVPDPPGYATTESPSKKKPVFRSSNLKDRVERLQAEKKSNPSRPKSDMAMEISNHSNHSKSIPPPKGNLKQILSGRRRSSLLSVIESMHQSIFRGVDKEETSAQFPDENLSSSVHTTGSLKQGLRTRRRSSLASMIESMHEALLGFVDKEEEEEGWNDEPFDNTTKRQSYFQKALADSAEKRRQRRQQWKDSLEYNSQAVSQIMETTEPDLTRSQTEPTMNRRWSKEKMKETLRRVSTVSGPLGALSLDWGKDLLKKSKKKKKRAKVKSSKGASSKAGSSAVKSPPDSQIKPAESPAASPKTFARTSSVGSLDGSLFHDSSATFSMRSEELLTVDSSGNKVFKKSSKKKKKGTKSGMPRKRSKEAPLEANSRSLSQLDLPEPDLLRAQTEPSVNLNSPKIINPALRRAQTLDSSLNEMLGKSKKKKKQTKSDMLHQVIPLKDELDDNEDSLSRKTRSSSRSKKKRTASSEKRSTKKDKSEKKEKKKNKKQPSPEKHGKKKIRESDEFLASSTLEQERPPVGPKPPSQMAKPCQYAPQGRKGGRSRSRSPRRRSIANQMNPKSPMSPLPTHPLFRSEHSPSSHKQSFRSRRPLPQDDPLWQSCEFPTPSDIMPTEAFDPFSAPKPTKPDVSIHDTQISTSLLRRGRKPNKDANKETVEADDQLPESKESDEGRGRSSTTRRGRSSVPQCSGSCIAPRSTTRVMSGSTTSRRIRAKSPRRSSMIQVSPESADGLSQLIQGCTSDSPHVSLQYSS